MIFPFLFIFNVFQGKPKKNESLWSVARGVFRMLRKNYGCVRVDFAQPFSLKVSFYFMTKIPLRNCEKDILTYSYFSRNNYFKFLLHAQWCCSKKRVLQLKTHARKWSAEYEMPLLQGINQKKTILLPIITGANETSLEHLEHLWH